MRYTILIGTALLLSFLTISQEVITLDQVLGIGLQNNYGINIARTNAEIARRNATPGNAGMLPAIDIQVGYTRGLSDVNMEVVTGAELIDADAGSDLFESGIGVTWTLFDGLSMFITYDKLNTLAEAGELNTRIRIENTMAELINAYYEIILQERVLTIYREQVKISRFRLELAQLRYETGSGSELEYMKANVELNADFSQQSDQQTRVKNSKIRLNDLLARDVLIDFVIKDSIRITTRLHYDSLRNIMKSTNRHVLLANNSLKISRLDVRNANAVRYPTLDLYAGYNYYLSNTEASFVNYNRYFGPQIGLTATFRLFDGLNLQRQYRNANSLLHTSELDLRRIENQMESFLAMVYNDYLNQLQMIDFENENLKLATRNLDIAKESYSVGTISSLQMREIQKNLLDAGLRLINAQYKAKLRETELYLLSGLMITE